MLCGGIDLCGRDRLPPSRGSAGYFSVQSVWRIGNAAGDDEPGGERADASARGLRALPQSAAGARAEREHAAEKDCWHATVLAVRGSLKVVGWEETQRELTGQRAWRRTGSRPGRRDSRF